MLHKIEINILKSNLGNSLKIQATIALRLSNKWYNKAKFVFKIKSSLKSIYKVLIIYSVPHVIECESGKVCNAYICKRNKKYNTY